MRTNKYIVICFLLAGIALLAKPAEAKDPITLLFSGSANGVLRSCHCPSSPWGGIAKRVWLTNRIRAAADSNNVVAVDTGDLFPPDYELDRAALMLDIYELMDVQAAAIGDQELAAGLDKWIDANREAGFWNEKKRSSSFPWLSGGYRLNSGPRRHRMLVEPWKLIDGGDLRIGIVSITSSRVWRFAGKKPDDLHVTDPDRIIDVFQRNTKQENLDMVVVLSHQGVEADRDLADRRDDIDLIIGGHSQSLISPPEVVNGVAICQAGKNAENLGVLVISPRKEAENIPSDSDSEADTEPHNTADKREANPFSPTVVSTPQWRIAQQIVPLKASVGDSKAAAELINEYYAEYDERNAERLASPAPDAKAENPQLVLGMPSNQVVMTAGSRRIVSVQLGNRGGAPLLIERVRSKSPWMELLEAPDRIAPGTNAEAQFGITAEEIDRFFRCDFSIICNDPLRKVVQGTFSGRVEGPMPGIMDAGSLWTNLYTKVVGSQKEQASPVSSESPREMSATNTQREVLVEYFYSPDCAECRDLERTVLSDFTNRFATAVDLRKYDVNVPSNYLHLARMQERLHIKSNEPVSMYIDGEIPLLGIEDIRSRLATVVAGRIGSNATHSAADKTSIDEPAQEPTAKSKTGVPPDDNNSGTAGKDENATGSDPPEALSKRLHSFTLPSILLAGLVDGVNPCAFATIVFFISILAVAGVKGSRLLLVGAGYTIAVFATYLLLGFGAFRLLRLAGGWSFLGDALRWGMGVVLVVLAVVSFRDAWIYSKSGQSKDVALQLPDRFKRKIHEIMRTRLNHSALFLSALGIGFLVTLLEAVCTGQVYLPTLVALSRYPETRDKSLILLILYNLMFVLPLIIVIIATFLGTRSDKLLKWSRQNVVWGKTAMGALFAGLAVTLIFIG